MNFHKLIKLSIVIFFVLISKSFAEKISETIEVSNVETMVEEKEAQKEIIRIKLQDVNEESFTNEVVLRGLNKITAKTYKLEGKIGETINFERLAVKPLKCWTAPATERPENKVLLKIYERKFDNTEVLIFYGWMFSSSPGLSGLEHFMYDITIEECKKELKNEGE